MIETTTPTPWWDDDSAPTPSVGEFQAAYESDSDLWWRIDCGHHQNLFDAALAERDAALLRAGAAEAVVSRVINVLRLARAVSPGLGMTIYVRDLEHALGATGPRPHTLGQHDD